MDSNKTTSYLDHHDESEMTHPCSSLEDNCSISSADEEAEMCFGDFLVYERRDSHLSDKEDANNGSSTSRGLKTFNSMISESNEEDNISAIALIESERRMSLPRPPRKAKSSLRRTTSAPEHQRRDSLKAFVGARVDTFSRNVDFVQEQAEAMMEKGKETSLHEWRKRSSLEQFIEDRVDIFSKNADFVHEQAMILIENESKRRSSSRKSLQEAAAVATAQAEKLQEIAGIDDKAAAAARRKPSIVDARVDLFATNADFVHDATISIFEKRTHGLAGKTPVPNTPNSNTISEETEDVVCVDKAEPLMSHSRRYSVKDTIEVYEKKINGSSAGETELETDETAESRPPQPRQSIKDFLDAQVDLFSNKADQFHDTTIAILEQGIQSSLEDSNGRRHSLHDFVLARASTFARNLDFAAKAISGRKKDEKEKEKETPPPQDRHGFAGCLTQET